MIIMIVMCHSKFLSKHLHRYATRGKSEILLRCVLNI